MPIRQQFQHSARVWQTHGQTDGRTDGRKELL